METKEQGLSDYRNALSALFHESDPRQQAAVFPDVVSEEFKTRYGPNLYNNLPYRGKVYDRKEGDAPEHQPVASAEVFLKQLESTNPDHMKEWQGIMQRVKDGVATISFEEKHYDPELKGWRILIRWMENYYTNPIGV